MTSVVPFTNNYTDHSTREGYQYEFHCMRCGNGYRSRFRKSVMGFGGRIASFGGSILGGDTGGKLQNIGWNAEWMHDGVAGATADKRLREAVEDVRPFFSQCHRCGQWVCNDVCWNKDAGLCTTCAPRLDQEIAGMQAEAQRQQLWTRIEGTDYASNINVVDRATGMCPGCNQETGGGKFCQHCGTPLTAAPAATKKFCTNCGNELAGAAAFCSECGTPAV